MRVTIDTETSFSIQKSTTKPRWSTFTCPCVARIIARYWCWPR